jgi:AcrR family transcriptional regulator
MVHDRPQDRRRAANHDRLLDAAEAILERDGFEGLTVARLAKAVDWTPGAMYRYVSGKDEILAALHQRCVGEIHEALTGVWKELDDEPDSDIRALAKVLAVGFVWREAARLRTTRFRFVAASLAHPQLLLDEETARPAIGRYMSLLSDVSARFIEAQGRGSLRTGNPIERALQIVSAVHGALQLAKVQRFAPGLFDAYAIADNLGLELIRGWARDPQEITRAWARVAQTHPFTELVP